MIMYIKYVFYIKFAITEKVKFINSIKALGKLIDFRFCLKEFVLKVN